MSRPAPPLPRVRIHPRHRRAGNDILNIVASPTALVDTLETLIYCKRTGELMAAESLESRLWPVEKSVARLEGAYEHVATKADIAELTAKVQLLQWITGIGFTVIAGLLIHFLG